MTTSAKSPSGARAPRVRRSVEPPAPRPRLKRKPYETELERLQGELVKLQYWVKETRAKVVIVFEGRDGAGKGGVIKRILERVSPRVFRVEALPAPNERERSQMYMQRYIARLPAGGEVVIFDRSWYNRLGVERVMGFSTEAEYLAFRHDCPWHEAEMIESGIHLVKYWLEVSQEEQTRRFRERMTDPRKLWKLGTIDLEAHRRWWEYTRAKEAMFAATDTETSPWYVIQGDDKRRARINCIRHLLSVIPYTDLTEGVVPKRLPARRAKPKGMRKSGHRYRWVG
ncbi:MAG: polyphosphate kinase 2 [Gemmatimonadota bacterium]|nr:polyphosphate kinase 2 [Gemmatimonadota bacterium]